MVCANSRIPLNPEVVVIMGLPIEPGTYSMDLTHSQLGFSVTHLGISSVRGTFDRYSGALYVGTDLDTTLVTVEAEMASINSGNQFRDQHVHGAEFLDVENHPQMEFRSTSITETADGYRMTGDLTIKAITHAVAFETTYNGSALFPMDNSTHYGFTAVGQISRSAFGVSYGVPLVSDEVELRLDVQFIAGTEG
jgi:polyisoprenoid-binding protein YceI